MQSRIVSWPLYHDTYRDFAGDTQHFIYIYIYISDAWMS